MSVQSQIGRMVDRRCGVSVAASPEELDAMAREAWHLPGEERVFCVRISRLDDMPDIRDALLILGDIVHGKTEGI